MSTISVSALPLVSLLVCLAATLFMTGVIWGIQVVHYPLFAQVGEASFRGYHTTHSNRITLVVLPPMVAQALTSLLLVFVRPPGMPAWAALIGLALVAVIWGSTVALQMPHHGRVAGANTSGRRAAIDALVRANWIRTTAWTAHSVLLLASTAAAVLA